MKNTVISKMTTGDFCNATLIYSESGLRSIVGLTIIIGLGTGVANLLVIASVYFFKSLRSLSNFFLVSLATADLLVGTVIVPIYSLTVFKWPIVGTTIGQVLDFIIIFGLSASSFSLVAVTYDRHLAISSPLQYSSKMTLKTCCVIVFAVWTGSLIVSLPNFITKELRPRSMYFIVFLTICFLFPLIFLVIVQIKIFEAVKRQLDLINLNKLGTKQKTTKMSLKESAKYHRNTSNQETLDKNRQNEKTIDCDEQEQNRQKRSTAKVKQQTRITVDVTEINNKNTKKKIGQQECEANKNWTNENIQDKNERSRSTNEQESTSIIRNSPVILYIKNKDNTECALPRIQSSNTSYDDILRQSQSSSANTMFQDVTPKSYKNDIIFNTKQSTNIANARKPNGLSREIAARAKQMLKHRKYSITMMIVIGCFALCWIPNVVVIVIQALAPDICSVIKYEQIFYITIMISLGNSLLNPFIYCTRMKGFRTAFKQIVKCKCQHGHLSDDISV